MQEPRLVFITLLLGAALAHAAETPPSGNKPNVIIVLTDDQGYGDLSLTGNPILKTTNMDRLAREGVQLTNFHVDSNDKPLCSAFYVTVVKTENPR